MDIRQSDPEPSLWVAARFGRELAIEVKEAIADAVRPLERRIAELEARGEMKYCGIWEEGREYLRGNFVTTNGSLWHAEQPTRRRPGTDSTYRLAVKKGTCT
jgi:hypothetical protein